MRKAELISWNVGNVPRLYADVEGASPFRLYDITVVVNDRCHCVVIISSYKCIRCG